MFKLVQDTTATVVDDPEAMTVDLDELCRVAAQEMLAMALLAERRAYLEAHGAELDAAGHHLVVASGYARARKVTTGAGMVEVQAPRVDDRREGERFSSAILPAYRRKSAKVTEVTEVTEVLPILYLCGLSTGDFAPALAEFFGSKAGLSASTVNRRGDPRCGLLPGRSGHGLQASRRRRGPVAPNQRPRAARSPGASRSHFHRRQATRKE